MADDLCHQTSGAVMTITINRPERRNALNASVAAGIAAALDKAEADPSVRAIVLTGAGDKAFCAGGDLQLDADGSPFTIDAADPRHYVAGLFRRMRACRLPLVARVNGHALAGGFGLLCACDLAVATEEALLGPTETRVGLFPMMILPHLLRIVPERALMEMCLTGEPITARDAIPLNLVNYTVPAEELDAKTDWLVERITSKTPTGIRLGKQSLAHIREMSFDHALEYAQFMLANMSRTEDAREGMTAFSEKRAPEWTGPMTDRPDTIRIGCGAGFWGDTPEGPKQLIERGALDYLILDYLAEITMSILARMKAKDPAAGYATDFVTHVAGPLAEQIAASGVKIVTNAGGLNPAACRDALEAAFREAGVTRKIALVLGDDLSDRADSLRAADLREMASGAPLPDRLSSINAYLGALPVARALADGADIVITGRVTDSALALGPLIHEFGWRDTDHDLLAAGSLAGHVLECGTQATGGIVTDWQDVPGWHDMGFPIAICAPDGSFELTKPEGTGGRITPLTVAEQITYEIGDPASYILPDVTCDFSQVTVTQAGPDRVRVSGAKGRAPTDSYKVCATYADGYRATATMTISGPQAGARAQATGEAILSRVARLAAQAGFSPFDETLVEVLGTGAAFGHDPRACAATEVVLRLSARHADKGALALFGREIYPAATAMAQGITGFAGGRPAPQPVIRLFSTFIDKAAVDIETDMGGSRHPVPVPGGQPATPHAPAAAPADPAPTGPTETLPLIALACARSGDKGDIANIGLLARDPAFLPVLRREVTADRVKARFAHVARGPVTRHEWPGLHGFNFVMERALGGGGIASLRNDPQGKGYAQALLMMPVAVPVDLIRAHPTLAAAANRTEEPA